MPNDIGVGPYSVVTNVLDCVNVISKFELQLCYYVHF